MCCRMIDDLRTVLFEDTVDTVLITYRTDQHHQVKLRLFPLQFLLDIICIVLIDVEDDQLLRTVLCDLSA